MRLETLVRFSLVGLAVALCYCFEWKWLRYLTSEINIRLDALAGISMSRWEQDSVLWHGVVYRYVNACTFVDVWCGSIPLLWNLRRTVSRNLTGIAVWTLGLFLFNNLRLCLSDILFEHGLSWNLAHNFVAGLAYFAVWMAIGRYHRWLNESKTNSSLPA